MPNLFDLSNKVSVVTGGTRGLGRAIVEAYLAAGATVILTSEDAQDCAAAEGALRGLGGDRVLSVKCDVRKDDEQRALVDLVTKRFGGVDILVANAGISDKFVGSIAASKVDYDRVMDINLHSIVRLCAMVVPVMKTRGGGSVILMSSLSALRGNKALGVYALTKAALAQLARNLAVEFGPDNIRANAIAPGFIRTELGAALMADQAFMTRRMQNTPMRRAGEPHEVAGPALFLAGDGGAFVTGQTIVVDGGTLITDGS